MIVLYFYYTDDRYNFDKKDIFNMNTFGLPYDYNSIMHYSRTSFTMRGATTLAAKHDPNMQLGGNKDLSKYDIMKINAMYHCHGKTLWRCYLLQFYSLSVLCP